MFGPVGTAWFFTGGDVLDRITHIPQTELWLRIALQDLYDKLCAQQPQRTLFLWIVPADDGEPQYPWQVPLMQNWIRTSINGLVGPDEQVVHTLNWVNRNSETAPITAETVKLVGDKVRDAWAAFFMSGNQQDFFAHGLTYTEVRSSLMHQDAPGAKPSWPLPTQVSPFVPTAVGGTGSAATSLPYEVAHCLTLNTNFRGTNRFRGRLYLGPLNMSMMGADGQFNSSPAESIAANFGSKVIAPVQAATDFDLHVISQKYCTSCAITGVRAGKTPDSQRRRRRGRPEAYKQAWGTPIGAL